MKTRRLLLPLAGLAGLLALLALQEDELEAPSEALEAPSVEAPTSEPRPTRGARDHLRADRVMVASTDLSALAQELGSEVLREAGPSGVGALAIPSDRSREDFLAELRGDRRVRHAGAEAWMHGAGDDDDDSSSSSSYGGHREAINSPAFKEKTDLSDWVVAVVDSGVASSGATQPLAGLADLDIVEPWDFVDADAQAYDENQHGSHVASLIASEDADYPGIAATASLMPLRVLDQDNQGTELDLVDALAHATEHGADVINLSLSFDLDYVPSAALLEAIEGAHEAGIVLVAAAGNEGSHRITWPAASPRVIAVASVEEGYWGSWTPTDFTNAGAGVSIAAPGKELVAETIGSKDASSSGYWLYTGTSQSAALVSGAVVWMLDKDIAPEDVPAALQENSSSLGWVYGVGDGLVDVKSARKSGNSATSYHASVLAYLTSSRAQAHVALVDEDGEAVDGAWVLGTLHGDADKRVSCYTDSEGTCTLTSSSLSLGDDDVYVFTVEQVLDGGVGYPVTALLYGTDGLEAVTAAVAHEGEVEDSLLGLYWDGSTDDDLGDLEEAYTILQTGSGIATSPLSVVFRPKALEPSAITADTLDLDASGIATSPLSLIDVRWLKLDSQTLLALDASGIATSPLSIRALDLVRKTSGSGIADSPLSFDSDPIFLARASSPTHSLTGTSIGDALDAGGFGSGGDGPGAATAGSSLVGEWDSSLVLSSESAQEVE